MPGIGQRSERFARVAKVVQALVALLGLAASAPLALRARRPEAARLVAVRGELATFAPRPAAEPAEPEPEVGAAPSGPAEDWRRLGAAALAGRRGRVTRGFSAHRLVHFTFDDGPNLETTPALLDTLAERGVRATFFVLGRQLGGPRSLERRALLQRIEAEGHTVAVHTYDHDDLSRLTAARINGDLDRVEATLEATLGYLPGLLRPPFGRRTAASDAVVQGRGYTEVLWNLPLEEDARTSAAIAANFARLLGRMERHPRGPGGIVLLHDTHSESVAAVPLLLDELDRRNCELLGREGAQQELWDVTEDLGPFLLHDDPLPEDLVAARQAAVRRRVAGRCAEGEPAADGGA